MRRLIVKFVFLAMVVYGVVIGVNYFIDPANIYHQGTVNKMVEYLNDNIVVGVPANIDEGVLQEKRISTLSWQPETVIIGSSHVMYLPFDYEKSYNAGMSCSYLGDYYSIVGLLKYYNKMPKRIVIGVDTWAFMRSSTDGVHQSVKRYSQYMTRCIGAYNEPSKNIDRDMKALVSFSYFQASVDFLKRKGLRKNENDANILTDSDDVQKILLDGRWVPSNKQFLSKSAINQSVYESLSTGNVYVMGSNFKDIQRENAAQFEALLEYLLANGIEVHIYLPAWHPIVYDYIAGNEAFTGFDRVESHMRMLGNKLNIPIHGGYDPSLCGITEDDYMDWLHLKPEKMLENYNYIR